MSNPLITVAMATITVDSHFVDAVQSVLSQTFTDFELVVVLDGPVEGAVPTFDDQRVRILQTSERHGTASALNLSVREARGLFIARLDADDLAMSGRFAAQVARLQADPRLVCVGSSVRLIDIDGRDLGVLDRPSGPGLSRTLLRRNIFAHSSVMFRRSAYEKAGRYEPECTRMQDYDLWLRMAPLGRFDNIVEPLTAYRIHPGQASRATPPWGPATRIILSSRSRLARQMGRSALRQKADDAFWVAAQTLRHFKLRRPGYERGLRLP